MTDILFLMYQYFGCMAFKWRNKSQLCFEDKWKSKIWEDMWVSKWQISFLGERYLHSIRRLAISGTYVFYVWSSASITKHPFLISVYWSDVSPIRFHICIWKINKSLTFLSPLAQVLGACWLATHAFSWWVCLSRSGVHKMCCIKIDTV